MALFIFLVVALGAVAYLLRRLLVREPEPQQPATCPLRRLGWLDDDGAPRGERWDGSWLSGPRTALSLA